MRPAEPATIGQVIVRNVTEIRRVRNRRSPEMTSLKRGAIPCNQSQRAGPLMLQRLLARTWTGTRSRFSGNVKSVTMSAPKLTQATTGPKSA